MNNGVLKCMAEAAARNCSLHDRELHMHVLKHYWVPCKCRECSCTCVHLFCALDYFVAKVLVRFA